MTKLEALDRMRRLITAHGWAVQSVEAGGPRPDWAYTVGLTPLGAPELLITGKKPQEACRILNGFAEHVLHAEPPEPGDQRPLVGGPLVEIVKVQRPDAHLLTAITFYGSEQVRALQLAWADDRGHWPWDVGFRSRRGGQPVLGPRAATQRRVAG
ncbi:DUF4262 domain-containing protein [Pseudonocardia acaciae]|uniref:DUF4262 domain-containing protein n=1 Tax=Pseudonocardia acaciae TaxID=551276 RepID=UPI001FE20479|nr:DUF4262 domain-containing protein [Pseudonocardia acaciae]